MNRLLILYPELFNCYEKFERKISRITQNLETFSVIYPNDPRGFIARFMGEQFPLTSLTKSDNWLNDSITHAIIFDDGEEFTNEATLIKTKSIPLRVIKLFITRVINIKQEPEYQGLKSTEAYEYIGRGSYWGNPYSMYEEGDDRDEVIRKYKYDFDFEKFPNKDKSEVYKLAGKRLGCFCKPQSCHGDVLADFLNSWDDGK